jgi:hypothetical protein
MLLLYSAEITGDVVTEAPSVIKELGCERKKLKFRHKRARNCNRPSQLVVNI